MNGTVRVTPRVWIGLAIFVGYIVLVLVLQILSGVPYTELGDSGANLFFGGGISLIVATIALAITASLLGWWRPALFERARSVRWPIIAPVILVVAIVLNLISTDWGAYDLAFFGASVVILLVGFTEEMMARGLLLTALRARLSEVWVWFLTSALFGLMHMLNAVNGQDIGVSLQQAGHAFLVGTVFYIARRTTGTLIWAMVLHGLWDFSAFGLNHGTAGPLANLGPTLDFVAGFLALATVWFVIRGADERLSASGRVPRPEAA